jgi:transcription initiation factor IIF auxiliary subunit
MVQVNSPPFQLVKRGWGEFPVRVQIHFKDPRNKRIDINKHIKLDWTQTGLQTFGGEEFKDVELVIKPNDYRATQEKNLVKQSQPQQQQPPQLTTPEISEIKNNYQDLLSLSVESKEEMSAANFLNINSVATDDFSKNGQTSSNSSTSAILDSNSNSNFQAESSACFDELMLNFKNKSSDQKPTQESINQISNEKANQLETQAPAVVNKPPPLVAIDQLLNLRPKSFNPPPLINSNGKNSNSKVASLINQHKHLSISKVVKSFNPISNSTVVPNLAISLAKISSIATAKPDTILDSGSNKSSLGFSKLQFNLSKSSISLKSKSSLMPNQTKVNNNTSNVSNNKVIYKVEPDDTVLNGEQSSPSIK